MKLVPVVEKKLAELQKEKEKVGSVVYISQLPYTTLHSYCYYVCSWSMCCKERHLPGK